MTNTTTTWTGSSWELAHAVTYVMEGRWTVDFAAQWLGLTVEEFKEVVINYWREI